jgi:hypothetical protein
MKAIIVIIFVSACSPHIVAKDIISPNATDTFKPDAYNISCDDMALCNRVMTGLCPGKYKIIGHEGLGPFENSIQIECQ